MLIGEDDNSNDVITLGSCFSMFVYIRARFRFLLIGGNLVLEQVKLVLKNSCTVAPFDANVTKEKAHM